MKKSIKLTALMMAIIMIMATLSACDLFGTDDSDGSSFGGGSSSSDKIDEDMSDEEMLETINNGIVFDEEAEGAKLSFKGAEKEDFIGSWEATSGQSIYMYGNIDLEIRDGGTFKANVAEEDLSGAWTYNNGSVSLKSEFFNAKLSFTKDGKLIMQEDRSGEDDESQYINTVLTRK